MSNPKWKNPPQDAATNIAFLRDEALESSQGGHQLHHQVMAWRGYALALEKRVAELERQTNRERQG